ncbi:hypothetical protein FWG86_02015 [Candidatus Saccharibacteria bacterium]|nr:hypothetical protein [Candidatus Saccharibacteria bacterium]
MKKPTKKPTKKPQAKPKTKLTQQGIALCVLAAVLALGGVVFAAYSATLTIKGGASYNQDAPLVRWQTGSISKSSTGGGSFDGAINTNISPDQLTIASYMALFNYAGSTTLQATIENVGSQDAEITAVGTPSISCTPQGAADATFATAICNQLSYVFEYTDNTPILVGDILDAGTDIDVHVVITLAAVPTVGTPGEVQITIGDQTISYGEVSE